MLNPDLQTPDRTESHPPGPVTGPLFAAAKKVYPKKIDGTFRRFKWAIMGLCLAVYYITPWLRWDRGPLAPDQAVLLDMPARKFYFFFFEIWSQEVYFMAGILILSALGLFLVTSLFGRAWCGYACPQTVWSDVYFHVERWIEGDRNQRIRQDKDPWKPKLIAQKTAKHIIWILIAVATGGAWIFYFADAPTLFTQLFDGSAPFMAYLFVGIFTATTYVLGGIAKEQVCIYMCPWPRIQGAMLDDESLIVSYKADRGEPRGPIRKHPLPGQETGDCIDCKACHYVCPMGIDIRDGAQMECIHCALCIDACDDIMDKVGRPRGLIAYDSFANQERRAQGQKERFPFIRTRTIWYSIVIALVSAVMVWAMLSRVDTDLNVLSDRNPVFVTLSDGSIRNGYTVRLLNKSPEARAYTAQVIGLGNPQVRWTSGASSDGLRVGADDLITARMFVALPADQLRDVLSNGVAHGTLQIFTSDGTLVAEETMRFQGPK
ncbi:MAG: cytochrome c oxidase accessory protein CcoG [Pseudomonadota bacterium]